MPSPVRLSYGIIGKTIAAYFDKINAEGASMAEDQFHII